MTEQEGCFLEWLNLRNVPRLCKAFTASSVETVELPAHAPTPVGHMPFLTRASHQAVSLLRLDSTFSSRADNSHKLTYFFLSICVTQRVKTWLPCPAKHSPVDPALFDFNMPTIANDILRKQVRLLLDNHNEKAIT